MAPPAPALPRKPATTRCDEVVRISWTRSSIALMLRQDFSAGSPASITLRWMPLEKKSAAAEQHDHPRGSAARKEEGVAETAALIGAHRAVVEIEVEVPDGFLLGVADFAERLIARPRRRAAARSIGILAARGPSDMHRRQLHSRPGPWSLALRCVIQTAPSTVARQIAPSRWDRICPGCTLLPILRMRSVEVVRSAEQIIQHAGRAVGGRDLPHDGGGRIPAPVDGAVALTHGRPQTAANLGLVIGERFRLEALAMQTWRRPPARRARPLR